MMFSRPILVRDRSLGTGVEPLVCVPLVGTDEAAILGELKAIKPNGPDIHILEWRVDFFSGLGDLARVRKLAREVKEAAGSIPILLTRRSTREGGQPIGLDEDKVFSIYEAVTRDGSVDLIDYELGLGSSRFEKAVWLARETGVKLIASHHDFQATPTVEKLVQIGQAMEQAGADIAKIAVMPQGPKDVLTLLEATRLLRETIELPIVTMSMGAYGTVSRLCGWLFGSSMTFAAGEKASAPGQLPLAQLDLALKALRDGFRSE